MRHLASTALLLTALGACQGTIGGASAPDPVEADGGTSGAPDAAPSAEDAAVPPAPDAGPPPCEPTAMAVPKLLRLSNHEYRSMVSDLVGAPVDEALFSRWTPVAEVYGFDTMSETRVDQQALEEQLATAEALASILLATPSLTAHCPAVLPEETPVCTSKVAYSARDDFSDTQARDCWSYLDGSGAPMIFDNTRSLWRKEPDETAFLWRDGAHPGSSVDVVRRWQAPLTGTATLSGSFADGDPGGGDGVLVSIRVNDRVAWTQDLGNGARTDFLRRVSVARGDLVDFVVNRKASPDYDTTAFAASIAFVPTPRKAVWSWDDCVDPLLRRLASRAFRRPVRADELADYRALYESSARGAAEAGFAEPVDEALKAVLEAVLLSPNFVFKPELVPGGVEERSYAIAARLGLFARGSLPDDATWALAERGAAFDETQLRAEAQRLLRAEVDRFAYHFGGQWLAYRDLGPSPLAESMRTESRAVFAGVMGEPIGKLLAPGFTVVDQPLADYYGLTTPGGRGPFRLLTEDRGGLLSQGVFLTRTGAGSEFRRPIHRGLWVMTRLLCRTLPRIDPATLEEINMSVGSIDPSLPLPERMRLHRSSSTRCPTCHAEIDPIGLALEKYDALGVWRDTYPDGTPIESDLELGGRRVRDPFELAAAIEATPEFRACVGAKLLTFALNRGPQASEQCVAAELGEQPTLEAMAIEALMKGVALTEVSR